MNALIAAFILSTTAPAGTEVTGDDTRLATSWFVNLFESITSAAGDLVYGGASGTPTRLAVSTTEGMALTADPNKTAKLAWEPARMIPGNALELLQTSFTGTVAGTEAWSNAVAGTSTAITFDTADVAGTFPYGLKFSLGTTNSGSINYYSSATPSITAATTQGRLIFEAQVDIDNLSSAGQTYQIQIGLVNGISGTGVEQNAGFWIDYTNGTDSGHWRCGEVDHVTANQYVDSGIAVTTGVHRLTGVLTPSGTPSYTCYIDGVSGGSVGTAPTIPLSSSLYLTPAVRAWKTNGTSTTVPMHLGYFYFRDELVAF